MSGRGEGDAGAGRPGSGGGAGDAVPVAGGGMQLLRAGVPLTLLLDLAKGAWLDSPAILNSERPAGPPAAPVPAAWTGLDCRV